ncbi:hypothetical protein HP397_06615, partial [Streptobacillus felis]
MLFLFFVGACVRINSEGAMIDVNKISDGKALNTPGDMKEIFDVKNGNVVVSSQSKDVLGFIKGKKVLEEIST